MNSLIRVAGQLAPTFPGVSCTVQRGINPFSRVCSWNAGAAGPTSSASPA